MEIQVLDKRNILNQDVVTYGDIENPLFLAKDVANWIEHSNPRMMLQNIDEEEKVVRNLYTQGGNQDTWFLTEDGLYEVLMQSRKPVAKEFKKRVKKLLKEIRLDKHQPKMSMEDIMINTLQEMKIVKSEVNEVREDLIDFKDNAPLFNIECDEISKGVRNLGARVLGGKKSNAYKDNSIRSQIYSDIYQQLKRQFGVNSYKAIKRGQLQKALNIINQYKAPIFLQELIECSNHQLEFK